MRILLSVVSHLILIPLFILAHRLLPDPNWPFHLDRILLLLMAVIGVELVIHRIQKIILTMVVLVFGLLTLGSITRTYGFHKLFEDYKNLIYSVSNTPNPQKLIISTLSPFPNKIEVKRAVDFDREIVRNFALTATATHFTVESKNNPQLRAVIQSLAIFKEVNGNWNYVSDPASREYIARASESVHHFSGDCDDYSILMAACILAIRGVPRLIYTNNHMYPELLIGNREQMKKINDLIKSNLFPKETEGASLFFHIDEQDRVWLNLDYTRHYPGGPFLDEKVLAVLSFE